MSLDECLPDSLRGPGTSITRITRGLSGAGVYRVQAAGTMYVLKIASEVEPVESWRAALDIQRRAGEAGVAPGLVHHDEVRRAVVTEHVADRGFSTRLYDPATRDAAIRELGEALRRLHTLPLPANATRRDLRDVVALRWAQLASFGIPAFARTAIDRALAETPPPESRPLVTSHNDPNPSNLVFDGARVMLLDWDTAGANDPFFDLATVAMFLRLDDSAASALIAAHDAAAPSALPEGFWYARRLVAALCAAMAFHLARQAGHAGGDVAVDRAPTLQDVQAVMRSGAFAPHTADGAWLFALALAREITNR